MMGGMSVVWLESLVVETSSKPVVVETKSKSAETKSELVATISLLQLSVLCQ